LTGRRSDSPAHINLEEQERPTRVDRPDAAIEGQFADDGAVAELLGSELPGGDEEGQGDGQVEAAGILAQVTVKVCVLLAWSSHHLNRERLKAVQSERLENRWSLHRP
jgi:hypothetical protein